MTASLNVNDVLLLQNVQAKRRSVLDKFMPDAIENCLVREIVVSPGEYNWELTSLGKKLLRKHTPICVYGGKVGDHTIVTSI